MKSRFNYTKRKRIYRRDVHVQVVKREAPTLTCTIDQTLDEYGFPPESSLVVEAYHRDQYERFERGTVALQDIETLDISGFLGAPKTNFRIKVLDADGSGRLLGLADGISLERPGIEDDSRDSLLPVRPADLGKRVWDLTFDEESGPTLEINEDIDDWRELAGADPVFVSSVLPAVLDRILTTILQERVYDPDPDSDDWQDRWIRTASELSGSPMSNADKVDADARRAWIDRAVTGFCENHKMTRLLARR